jgi:hypothetical protein
MFISSVSSYYIFEYYSSKRKKQPDRGNNSSVFHTFILLFLTVAFFSRYTRSCRSFRFLHKNHFWFPFFLQACHVQRSLHPPSFDHQTNIWWGLRRPSSLSNFLPGNLALGICASLKRSLVTRHVTNSQYGTSTAPFIHNHDWFTIIAVKIPKELL